MAGLSEALNSCQRKFNTLNNRTQFDICSLSMENRMNPGFMVGMAGIGYTLLRAEYCDLLNVIALE